MDHLCDFLCDDYAYKKWADADEDNHYILEHVKKAASVAMEVELTEAQKRYITHYVIEGKTMEEIANIYGVNKSTVSKVIHAGRVRLMRCLRYSAPWLLNAEMVKLNRKRWKY